MVKREVIAFALYKGLAFPIVDFKMCQIHRLRHRMLTTYLLYFYQ